MIWCVLGLRREITKLEADIEALNGEIKAVKAEIKCEVNADELKRKEARRDTLERKSAAMEERLTARVKQSAGMYDK